MRTLKACEIDDDDYFSRLISEDITKIARSIKEAHSKDAETGDDNDPLNEVLDIVNEYSSNTDTMKATLYTVGRQLGMNFKKMDPPEVQFFTTIVEKYSTVYQKMKQHKGRGKKQRS